MRSTLIRLAASLVLVVPVFLAAIPAAPAAAAAGKIQGTITSKATGQPLANVCVTLGPPIKCFGAFGSNPGLHTNVAGFYMIDLDALAANDGGTWDLYFLLDGYKTLYSGKFVSNGGFTYNGQMEVKPIVPRASCTDPGPETGPALTTTVYLPNITRRLGGPDGFYTPFIVQNTGALTTLLEVSFYKFTDGSCVSRYQVFSLPPGTSHANNPNDNGQNPTLPDDAQFSVVVRSFGSQIVGVVNEHAGTGTRAEALSYNGFTAGAKTVYLPNITRRFFGLFFTPFIIQNLGTGTASVTATFRAFDGTGAPVVIPRSIEPGRAKPIDPNSNDINLGAPGLVDGKQYAVTVASNQDVAVVVNTQADAPNVANPVAWATDGTVSGGATLYGAYAAKNAQGVGRYSTIVVQNLGAAAVTPKITFTPLAGGMGTANTYTFPAIQPNASKAFDPRFSFSTQGTTNTLCTTGGTDCLADGEYSIKIEAAGGNIAAQVNVSTAVTGMGYSATAAPATKFFLPNVTKGLCFCPTSSATVGWTTPILLQSVAATTVTLRWYNFLGGALVHTQTVNMTVGTGTRIDPWTITQLTADRQYSVVVDGGTGTVTAIVVELRPDDKGDAAMIYEGIASP
ncbi:MAG TPA: hypothetical protein VGR87_15680 [Candidatus Limnocylindria bacterium]|jgi:hypothetical protein|nr:hypothetical protein [Candidatus Limnocylindria bacterium]